jgi:hypothetical protein
LARLPAWDSGESERLFPKETDDPERCLGINLKLFGCSALLQTDGPMFAFIPETLFGIIPESRSLSVHFAPEFPLSPLQTRTMPA